MEIGRQPKVDTDSLGLGLLLHGANIAPLSYHRQGCLLSNELSMRSSNERSSFFGLFTRVEIGHIVMGSEG
jgi:hypothetical protein